MVQTHTFTPRLFCNYQDPFEVNSGKTADFNSLSSPFPLVVSWKEWLNENSILRVFFCDVCYIKRQNNLKNIKNLIKLYEGNWNISFDFCLLCSRNRSQPRIEIKIFLQDIKCSTSSRWLFGPNTAWCSIETKTIRKTSSLESVFDLSRRSQREESPNTHYSILHQLFSVKTWRYIFSENCFQRAGPAHMLTHSLSGQHIENTMPLFAQVGL